MNRNYLIGFAAAAVLLGALAFAAWSFFEIYPRTEFIFPSREARINEYLALDRWLAGMGCQTRTEQSGDLSLISEAEEKRIFIQASLFKWNDETVEYLVRWIEDGGNLFLALDNFLGGDYWEDEEFLPLLEEFGIEARAGDSVSFYDPEFPDYDDDVSFEAAGNGETLFLKNTDGVIKLAQVKRGKGKLTVTGRPFFLYSQHINSTPNARLAWALFAPCPEYPANGENMTHNGKEGLLFIRGTARARGLLGNLFRRGNPAVLVVSFLVLLVIGFWTVIPGFGIVRFDEETPGKPLRERFLAEGRFLKRYGALEFYRDVYVTEIKRLLARKEGLSSDDEIVNRVLRIWGEIKGQRDKPMLLAIFHGKHFTYRDFPKMIVILKGVLERI